MYDTYHMSTYTYICIASNREAMQNFRLKASGLGIQNAFNFISKLAAATARKQGRRNEWKGEKWGERGAHLGKYQTVMSYQVSQLCLSFTSHLTEKKDGPFIRSPSTVNICVLIVLVVVAIAIVIVIEIGTYNGQSINDILCVSMPLLC